MSETEAQAETDVLLPAQRVYTMAVVAAEREYRAACKAAWDKRQKAIDEALEACMIAMREGDEAQR